MFHVFTGGAQFEAYVQSGNCSVGRGGSLSADFKKHNYSALSSPSVHEYVLDLIHPHWKSSILFFNGRAKRLDSEGIEAGVVLLSHKKIILKWDKWGEETFIREKEGVYRLDP